MPRPNEPALPDPLAYFITWSTYGTWLPGDARGWVEYRRGWKLPDPIRELEAAASMSEDACVLTAHQRMEVEAQVKETCEFRKWILYAVNCRTNHMHLVVAAPVHPKLVRSQIKAWCTRRLKGMCQEATEPAIRNRTNFWAERGSQRYINDSDGLEAAIIYVLDAQDRLR